MIRSWNLYAGEPAEVRLPPVPCPGTPWQASRVLRKQFSPPPQIKSSKTSLSKQWRKTMLSGEFPCFAKSGRSECSWSPHLDVSGLENPSNVSIRCWRVLWGQSNFHNHCRLIPQHCLQLLCGKEEGLCLSRDTAVQHRWGHNSKTPRPAVEASRHRFPCENGSKYFLDCLGENQNKEEEDRRPLHLQVYFYLRPQAQRRASGGWRLVPSFQVAAACWSSPAAALDQNKENCDTFSIFAALQLNNAWSGQPERSGEWLQRSETGCCS